MTRLGKLAKAVIVVVAAIATVGCQTPSRRAPVVIPADAPLHHRRRVVFNT